MTSHDQAMGAAVSESKERKTGMSESTCRYCGRGIVRNFGEDWVVPLNPTEAVKKCSESPDGKHEPSLELGATPTECLCDEYGKDLCAIHNVQPELPKLQLTEADKESVRNSSREYPDLPSVYFMTLAQLMCRERQLLDALRAIQAWRGVAQQQDDAWSSRMKLTVKLE